MGTANWQRQGKKGAKRPEPISPLAKRSKPIHAGDPAGHDVDETVALLERYRTGVFARG